MLKPFRFILTAVLMSIASSAIAQTTRPTAYIAVAYAPKPPIPRELLTLPIAQQIGTATLPFTAHQIAYVRGCNGTIYLDYENLSVSDPKTVTEANINGLKAAFRACKSPNNRLSWYTFVGSFNVWEKWNDPNAVALVQMLKERGVFDNLDTVCINGYYWNTAPMSAAEALLWERVVLRGVHLAQVAGKPALLFLSPRSWGGGVATDDKPVDLPSWRVMCGFARALREAGLIEAPVMWDESHYDRSWVPGLLDQHYAEYNKICGR